MKIRMLSRNPSDFRRETADDIFKIPRNQSITEHPFAPEREYVRALNAAKIGRMMAKPFLGALEGTNERMTALSLNTETLGLAVFGTADGKIQYWDIAKRNRIFEVPVHDSEVRGICHFNKSRLMYTVIVILEVAELFQELIDLRSLDRLFLNLLQLPREFDQSIVLGLLATTDKEHDLQFHDMCTLCNYLYEILSHCSLDGQLKQWRMNHDDIASAWKQPLSSVLMKWPPHCMDHHPSSNEFLIGGAESCLLYSSIKLDVPLREWSWGQEPVHAAKFNPVEHNIACALTKDNSLMLIDCRQDQPIRKVKMELKLNSFSWNPMEPFIFTAASEDYNVYTFDNRYFKFPRRVYRGHVNAVLGVDYSPTGREFVTGSYDSSIRLWQCDSTESFDVYHTRRMKRVLDVRFTLDAKFVLSSSTDQNVRLWKAHANEIIGPIQPRQKASLQTFESLREKFKDHPEVRKILKHRHLPKSIHAANKEHAIIRAKERRKERNTRLYNKNDMPFVSDREKRVVAQYK